jgi:polyisoprenoid-binding protein YceI
MCPTASIRQFSGSGGHYSSDLPVRIAILRHMKQLTRVRRLALAGGAVLALAGSAAGFTAYSVLQPTAEASVPIESVLSTSPLQDGAGVYTIDSARASASFTVDEVLRGSPYTVVGKTDQVAGRFTFDPANPSAARLGTITVDARTLATDDASRNRALGNRILDSKTYEYITFTPDELSGLPSSVSVGQPFSFGASGELTIKGVSRPATFEVTLKPASDGSLSGSATSTVAYADWGVSIPSVPFVASVGQEVTLAVNFEA